MQALIGQKKSQGQKFLEDGTRIPVTHIVCSGGNVVVQQKTVEKDGYNSLQLGLGAFKRPGKAAQGHIKRTASDAVPRFLREVKVADPEDLKNPGEVIKPVEVFEPGDIVDVTGVSKGKGFAGVVKRHHFKGGPRTHGQSDRERAPGSIGQTTTPGRVYKGKRMAGRMGHENVTVKNLQVVEVGDDYILVKGLVPGPVNNLIMVTKVGVSKKFVPLYREKVDGEEIQVQDENNKTATTENTEERQETLKEEIATTASNAAEAETQNADETQNEELSVSEKLSDSEVAASNATPAGEALGNSESANVKTAGDVEEEVKQPEEVVQESAQEESVEAAREEVGNVEKVEKPASAKASVDKKEDNGSK